MASGRTPRDPHPPSGCALRHPLPQCGRGKNTAPTSPSPASREREGPAPQAWKGEGYCQIPCRLVDAAPVGSSVRPVLKDYILIGEFGPDTIRIGKPPFAPSPYAFGYALIDLFNEPIWPTVQPFARQTFEQPH